MFVVFLGNYMVLTLTSYEYQYQSGSGSIEEYSPTFRIMDTTVSKESPAKKSRKIN